MVVQLVVGEGLGVGRYATNQGLQGERRRGVIRNRLYGDDRGLAPKIYGESNPGGRVVEKVFPWERLAIFWAAVGVTRAGRGYIAEFTCADRRTVDDDPTLVLKGRRKGR